MKAFNITIRTLLMAVISIVASYSAIAQFQVMRVYGTDCVGAPNVYTFTGGDCSSLTWGVAGGGSITSGQYSSSVQVVWNSPTSDAYVYVSYNCSSYPYSGTAYSSTHSVTNPVTPSVSISASAGSVCQGGGSITFYASPVNGGSSPSYNWYVDGSYVASGSSSQLSYNTSSLGAGSHYAYVVLISNAPCLSSSTATSSNVGFNVDARATYSVNVNGPGVVCSNGSSETFYATVSGTYSNPAYQWYKNTAPVATGNPYNTTVNQGDAIYCVVSSDGCVVSPATSGTYTVTISGPVTPTASIQIPKLNWCTGETISFTASTSHGGSGYSWRLNGNQFSTSTSTSLPVTTNTSTPNAFSPGDIVTLDVTGMSGTCLTSTSASATTSGIPFTFNDVVTPAVSLSAPNVCLPGNVNLTATPTHGGANPVYIFYIDGSQVSAGSSSTYSGSIGAGSHTAYVVMNSTAPCATSGSATSTAKTFVVENKASYTVTNNGPGYICTSDPNGTFYAVVTNGVGNLTYQWFKNGGGPNATTNPYVTSVAQGDGIYCRVASDYWCVNSPQQSNTYNVSMTTTINPSVSIQVPKLNWCTGETIALSASSSHGGTSYSWQLNGNEFATTSSTSLPVSTNTNLPNTFSPGDVVTVTVAGLSGTCLSSTSATGSTSSIPLVINDVVVPGVSLNTPPTACAGSTTTFTATPQNGGSVPTYYWFLDNVQVQAGASATYITSASLAPGPHALYVTMNTVAPCPSAPSATSATVSAAVNRPPMVDAGTAPNLVLPVTSTTLTGTASDPDGTTPALMWQRLAGGESTIANINAAATAVSDLVSGTYIFRLTASDQCTSAFDDVSFTVTYPPNNYNWIKETTVLVKDQTSESQVTGALITDGKKAISWNYFDGLSKPMQTINVQNSPLGNDIVSPILYDAIGRADRKYLPVTLAQTNGYYKINSQIVDYTTWNYKGDAAGLYTDSRPYSEKVFEPSPVNQPVKEYGPGIDWKSNEKYVTNQVLVNTHRTSSTPSLNDEKIIAWQVGGSGLPTRRSPLSGYIETGGYYSSGRLTIRSAKDEQGNLVREYSDGDKVILRKVQLIKDMTDLNSGVHWALTYSVYDDFGNLRFVLQPVLSAKMHLNNTNEPTADDVNKLAFQYKYDTRYRLIEKTIPGAEPVYMVYDKFSRLVLTQDGNQRKDINGIDKKEWSFTKYDALNRPIMTGIYTHPVVLSQSAMASEFEANNIVSGSEYYNGNAGTDGYSDNIFPTSTASRVVLTVNYYDDDSFKTIIGGSIFQAGETNYKHNVVTGQYVYDPALNNSFPYTRGVITGTKTKVLDENKYLWTINYFDDHDKIVQSVATNILDGVDRLTNVYDFTGKVVNNQLSHRVGTTTNVVTRNYEYDHTGRLKKIWHQLNDHTKIILTGHDYDEKGQLITKKLYATADANIDDEGTSYHNQAVIEVSQYNNEKFIIAKEQVILKPGFTVPAGKSFIARPEKAWDTSNSNPPVTSYAQAIDYQYNIRGWIADINDVDSPGKDMFSMRLNYNSPTTLFGDAQYNGNIRSTQWTTSGFDKQAYGYQYDAAGRFNEARYYNLIQSSQNDRYNEKIPIIAAMLSGYDLNGNIQRLQRRGKQDASTYDIIDDLTYTYVDGTGATTGNQLNRVQDIQPTTPLEVGFVEDDEVVDEYRYDRNGNMRFDENKNINTIIYNSLNLPREVRKSASDYILFTYDATGRKLKQEVFGTDAKVTTYSGDFTYEGTTPQLKFIDHEEGRLLPGGSLPDYEYFLKDHLGNTRVAFKGKSETKEDKATLEDNTLAYEFDYFENYPEPGYRSSLPEFDHTDVPGTVYTKSQLVNGSLGHQIGLAKSFEVRAGDIFDLEVFAKYEDNPGQPADLNTLFTALAATFSLPASGGSGLESQQAYEQFEDLYDGAIYIGDEEPYKDPAAPKAYLNYVLFNSSFQMLDFGYDQIDIAATMNSVHDQLSLHVKVETSGYLYVFLSNENPTQKNVYFDDFSIVRHTAIEEANDYYPFGLTFNTFDGSSDVENKKRFQGQEHIDALDLNWDSFKFRSHQPDVGRFFTIDPLAEKYDYNSPYAFSENKITNGVEFEGLEYFNATSRVGFAMGPSFTTVNKYINIERQSHDVTKNKLKEVVFVARGYRDPDLTTKLYDTDVDWYMHHGAPARRRWTEDVPGKGKLVLPPEYIKPGQGGGFAASGQAAVILAEVLNVTTNMLVGEDLNLTMDHARKMVDTWTIVESASEQCLLPEGFDLKNKIDLANYILDTALPARARARDGTQTEYSKTIAALGKMLFEQRHKFLRKKRKRDDEEEQK